MKYLEKWSTQYMKTPGNLARPETWLENTLLIFFSAPCKIQGIFFAKKVVGHNFWTEGPTDLRLTFLSCIFDGLFGDTPLDHIFSHMPICPYAHYGHIWPNNIYGPVSIWIIIPLKCHIMYIYNFIEFLSDPGIPGVQSMGPVVSKYGTYLPPYGKHVLAS